MARFCELSCEQLERQSLVVRAISILIGMGQRAIAALQLPQVKSGPAGDVFNPKLREELNPILERRFKLSTSRLVVKDG